MKYLPKTFARLRSIFIRFAKLPFAPTLQNDTEFSEELNQFPFPTFAGSWTFVRGHVFFLRDLRSLNVSIPTCLFASSSMIPHFKSASTLGFEQLLQLLFSP